MSAVKNTEVASRIRELIADVNAKSLRAYALSINVDPSQFAKVLSGERPITEKVLKQLVKTYNVRSEWLLYGRGEKYGQGSPQELPKPGMSVDGGDLQNTYLPEYIASLKAHNEFLQDLVKSNLTGISDTQRIILAQVKAGLQYDARKLSGGNKKKEAEALQELNTLVAANLLGVQPKDSKVDQHM